MASTYYLLLICACAVAVMGTIWVGQFLTSFSMFYDAYGFSGVAFKYGMWEGIEQLYDQKLYGVSIIILLWSGIWPHFKLLLVMLFNWIPATSTRKLSLYHWLSEFGKWSFVDVWVVTLISVIVRMPSGSLKPPGEAAWFQAIGDNGCYVFAAAVVLSQVLSIFLIRHYRKEAENEIALTASNLAAYNPLMGPGNGIFEFDLSSFPDDDKVCLRGYLRNKNGHLSNAVSTLIVFLGLFVVAATFVPCYHVSYFDVIGNTTFNSVDYSLFTGFIEVGHPNHVGQCDVILAIVGMICVVILPILQVVALLITWWLPYSLQTHKRLALVQEHMGHWACMESYFLAVGVVVYEIGDLLRSSKELMMLVNVSVKLKPEFYFLVVVSVLFSLLRWYILRTHARIIRATVEGEVLGQWRKPVYRSNSGARSDSFGIGM